MTDIAEILDTEHAEGDRPLVMRDDEIELVLAALALVIEAPSGDGVPDVCLQLCKRRARKIADYLERTLNTEPND